MFTLINCGYFYASCERTFRSGLRLCPLVVLSNNDDCIIARLGVAKALSTQMGTLEFIG